MMPDKPQVLPSLNIVVALACEAKPLVDRYRLIKRQGTVFQHFCQKYDDRQAFKINLVVSGIGADNMAAACGWLGALTGDAAATWLNIGIAGHADMDIGQIARVVSCSEPGSNLRHYPPLVAKWNGLNTAIMSYRQPCTEYPDGYAVDMEATAFFATAVRFSSPELVQSLKIISDNRTTGPVQLSRSETSDLIAVQTDSIDRFAGNLLALLPPRLQQNDGLGKIGHLHVTASQQQQFGDLLSKLVNLSVDDAILAEKMAAATSMRMLLKELRDLQQQTVPDLALVAKQG